MSFAPSSREPSVSGGSDPPPARAPDRDAPKAASALPSISIPKGGGAIRGIGEKFGVNAVNGTSSLTIPVAASPGRGEFGPQLSLSYDSGSGNGPFGFGWSLSLPSITRKTDKGLPRYRDDDESDVFILSGSEDLVPSLDGSGQPILISRRLHGLDYVIRCYRPRIERLFARIERWTAKNSGISHWRSITRENVTTLYGFEASSRIADPDDPRRVFAWNICRTWDDKGNVSVYDYLAGDERGIDTAKTHESNRNTAARTTNRYLKRICYGGNAPYFPVWTAEDPETPLPASWHFEIVLDYGDHPELNPLPAPSESWSVRPDPFSAFRSGFEVRTYRRCARVLLFHHFALEPEVGNDCLVRSTDFRYSDQEQPADPRNPIYTFLTSVTQVGYRRDGAGYVRRAMPPLELEYSEPHVQADVLTLDRASQANLPTGLEGAGAQFVDLDGEGLSGILTDHGEAWGYKRNLSPVATDSHAQFSPMEEVVTLPSRSALSGGQQLLDLGGDGQLDLVSFADPVAGFFERTSEQGWEALRTFPSLPRIDWREPNLRFVDLTGDGHADVLITEDGVFTFYPSLGENGFDEAERVPLPSDERSGPAVVFADGTQTIFLADMTGDGLSDLVRIRNGEVCYWPSIGYGRFGARITMDDAPRFTDEERFDPRRIRLADIDGSGTTDLLYTGDDGVLVCFNRSGNGWAEPRRLAIFPSADMLSSVQVVDLLGNGTACLVWSSPLPAAATAPLRYVDLMGGQKPHLLIRIRNNLGAETRLLYAPSTRFYLADKLADHPWITRVHFPIHVVERIETYDWIGRSRFVTTYAYRHGFFDGEERELRGFGMVEQRDTETHRDDTLFPDADPVNEDASSFAPPVVTRTWFHTGAFIEASNVSRQFAHEYWTEPLLRGSDPAVVAAREAMLLPDTVIEGSVPVSEIREAYRALKGSTLRIEVFAEDGSGRAEHPYMVTEQNLTVRRVQPRGPNQHAVFFTHPREAISYHYERQPDDPRIAHELTLEVDDFGGVRRSLSIGYPRRPGFPDPEPHLSAAFRAMLAHDQSRLHVSATERLCTNAVNRPDSALPIDSYRAPLPSEVITAELTGIAPAAGRFTFDELNVHWTNLWSGASDIPYETVSIADIDGTPTASPAARRIVEQSRILYRSDDLTALLPLHSLESMALPGESCRLALTPGHVTRLFGSLVTDAVLFEGGYMHPPGRTDWWIPSGRVFHSPVDGDSAPNELAEARTHFYRPRRAVDPFGAISRISYDAYDLLPRSATDAVGNITSSDNDYRVLHPFRATDPNGNQSEVAFSALGEAVGTAVRGKAGEGDSLAGFERDLPQTSLDAVRADPLADPTAILGSATSRTIYDDLAYFRTRAQANPDPPAVYTLARETHVSDLAAGERTRYQHHFAYSDGMGRIAQQKAQAEPDAGGAPRWVGSGWTIYNNKGKPVRQYEPFFTATHRFEFNPLAGVSSVLFYDPLERVVGTLHPDSTFEKTRFDAWRSETWDRNDTVLISDPRADADVGDFFLRLFGSAAFTSWHDLRIGGTHGATSEERLANKDAATKAAAHAGTPSVEHFDSLARTCLSVADNGNDGGGVPQQYATRTAFDPEGQQLCVFDALGRHVMEWCLREPQGSGFRYVAGYDIAGNPLYRNGMDGGERRLLNDVAGNPIRTFDARGSEFRYRYDASRRPTHRYVTAAGGTEALLERLVYGEGHPDAARNLKGRLYRHYDGAGVASHDRYDFKGNLLESGQRIAAGYRSRPDWLVIETIAETPIDVTALDHDTSALLDANDAFTASTRFNARNQPIQIVTPHTAVGKPSVLQPFYNEAALLERMDVWIREPGAPAVLLDPSTAGLHAIANIDYDAHGKRTLIAHGNGTATTYAYDPKTFVLTGLITRRPHTDADARTVQDLAYTYDPAGNITAIRDTADIHNVVFFRNQRVEPSAGYTYDPLYRLIAATGREHVGQAGVSQVTSDDSPRVRLLHPSDGNAMANYTEAYSYDPVGNLLAMVHQLATGGWTRRYAYSDASRITAGETSNRLSSTSLPGDAAAGPFSAAYSHDEHGSMTRMPHLPGMTWDVQDRLQSTSRQSTTVGVPETTYYIYDGGGERARKITDTSGTAPTRKSERIYLGFVEVYREYDNAGSVTLERETLHVLDDKQRVVMVETRTDTAAAQLVRYQYSTHLGSAALELDDNADVISYEEYFPYGATSYQAVRDLTEMPKRYRYTGKERDDDSDLDYYGARYYASWLGRWTSCDPIGLADGVNLLVYGNNNPVRFADRKGHQATETTKSKTPPDTSTTQNRPTSHALDLYRFNLPQYKPAPRPTGLEINVDTHGIQTITNYDKLIPVTVPGDYKITAVKFSLGPSAGLKLGLITLTAGAGGYLSIGKKIFTGVESGAEAGLFFQTIAGVNVGTKTEPLNKKHTSSLSASGTIANQTKDVWTTEKGKPVEQSSVKLPNLEKPVTSQKTGKPMKVGALEIKFGLGLGVDYEQTETTVLKYATKVVVPAGVRDNTFVHSRYNQGYTLRVYYK